MLNKDNEEETEKKCEEEEQPTSNLAKKVLLGVAGTSAVVATGGLALTFAGFGVGGIVSGSVHLILAESK